MDLMARRQALIASQPHIETVQSGNTEDSAIMAHFKTSISLPIKSLIVQIPYTPSGLMGIMIKAVGVNVLQCDTFVNGSNGGVAFTGEKNESGEILQIDGVGKATKNNIFGNLNYKAGQRSLPPDGKYATYAYTDDANISFISNALILDINGKNMTQETVGRWTRYNYSYQSSYGSETWARIQLMPYYGNGTTYNTEIKPMICLASDQDCDFEPYKGRHFQVTFPETIYGGTFDLITGELISTYAAGGTQMANPAIYQLPPQTTIKTLKGINNIWSDNGNVTVKYWSH